MITEAKVRAAVRKYLGRNHEFCGEILDDDWSEKVRFSDYAGPAMDQAEFNDDDMEVTDGVTGYAMWHYAVNEVQRQFLIWLITSEFTRDELKEMFKEGCK